MQTDTICAIATASGRAGIGIIRISGKDASAVVHSLLKKELRPRFAHSCEFYSANDEVLDKGLAILFPAPHSFTGEDVLELHGHGSPVLLKLLMQEITSLGVRQANPGEFSQRAFLNNKIDLVQAEAIADIIDSQSATAARSAMRSLSGEFSNKIHRLVENLIHLRMYVESAIDFPEEEIDFVSSEFVVDSLKQLITRTKEIIAQAKQGALMVEGLTAVIIGKPNAGKSSLLNFLSQAETAIVNPQAGTTRDILRQDILLDDIPLHLIDTAGLRTTNDEIELEGIRRAIKEINQADITLLMRDSSVEKNITSLSEISEELAQFNIKLSTEDLDKKKIIVVNNKFDLLENADNSCALGYKPLANNGYEIAVSLKEKQGLNKLTELIKTIAGYSNEEENTFTARSRHLDALHRALGFLQQGENQLIEKNAGELLAEDLKQAQNYLGEITGEYTPDDLLGDIFSKFCIGK